MHVDLFSVVISDGDIRKWSCAVLVTWCLRRLLRENIAVPSNVRRRDAWSGIQRAASAQRWRWQLSIVHWNHICTREMHSLRKHVNKPRLRVEGWRSVLLLLTWMTTPTMLCTDMMMTARPQCSVGTRDPYLNNKLDYDYSHGISASYAMLGISPESSDTVLSVVPPSKTACTPLYSIQLVKNLLTCSHWHLFFSMSWRGCGSIASLVYSDLDLFKIHPDLKSLVRINWHALVVLKAWLIFG